MLMILLRSPFFAIDLTALLRALARRRDMASLMQTVCRDTYFFAARRVRITPVLQRSAQ